MTCGDGRYSYKGKKICYGYQIVARQKFGEKIKSVASSKSKTDLTISHLCGTRNCINRKHLILETKEINDERVHCHFAFRNV